MTRQLLMFPVFPGIMLAPVGTNIATAYEYDAAQRLAQDGDGDTGEEGTDEGEDPYAEDPNAVQDDQGTG